MNLTKLSFNIIDRKIYIDCTKKEIKHGDFVFCLGVNTFGIFEYSFFSIQDKIKPGVMVHIYQQDYLNIPKTTTKSEYSEKFTCEFMLDENIKSDDNCLSLLILNNNNLKDRLSTNLYKEFIDIKKQIKKFDLDKNYIQEYF